MSHLPGFRRRMICLAVAAAFAGLPGGAFANGTGAQVVNGQALITSQGRTMTVVNSPGAIINWQSFSIARDEATIFQQQSAASTVLNRVVGQNPSQILGTLSSNGRVFLVNPNGMVFGRDAVISTNGFVASTLGITDQNFRDAMARGEALRFANGGNAGAIQVDGQIQGNAGDVYLIAPRVATGGTAIVSSHGGNVVLAAGESVEIRGRNLNDIAFQVGGSGNDAVNLGTLSGGAVGVFAGTLRHSGIVRATTLANEGGRIVLKAQGDVTLGAGSLVSAEGATRGGSIGIESQAGNVTVETGAQASARAAGGAGGDIAVQASSGIAAIESAARLSAAGAQGGSVAVSARHIVQDGAIDADGTTSAGGSVSLFGERRVIQTAGSATSATGIERGGSIVIAAGADSDGNVFTSGRVDASATTGVGGSVRFAGHDLSFVAAQVDAGGDAGGGVIDAGGRRDNNDPGLPNSQTVYANAAVTFRASARREGDGGVITVWSDDSTRFSGYLEARGGAASGNGGSIEISGRNTTSFGNLADAGAPHGAGGTVTIDPKYILIQAPATGQSVELIDPNPGNNNQFGQNLTTLGNGNILVFNPRDDLAGANAGAVYLYDGISGALVSAVRGGTAGDQVGSNGMQPLSGGNFYIRSPNWNGLAGALTLGNMTTGVSGTVSAANSLVGSTAGDQVGYGGITFLGSKFAVLSPNWNGNRGAVTWGDAATGVVGAVSASNSLVGSTTGDVVGQGGLTALFNSNYALVNTSWNSGAGAVTFLNPAALPVGALSSANSLVGGNAGDAIGSGFQNLFNGHALLRSASWNGNRGAITLFDTVNGTFGTVSGTNSLVGSTAGDQIGNGLFINFGNGKGSIQSPYWNGNAGAVTVIDLAAGATGALSSTNSLVGALANDQIGSGSIVQLGSGNYVVFSPIASVGGVSLSGAVTFLDRNAGITGVVSAANSLVGSHANDQVGNGGLTQVSGGNYVLLNPQWNSNRGAVTWASGTAAITGTPDAITSAQGSSVYGSNTGDRIGSSGIWQLPNGNFLVKSPLWANTPAAPNAGAITFGFASSGFGATAPVSAGNSLVGGASGDAVGSGGITNLPSGNYVVSSPNWASGAGAVTFGDSGAIAAGTVGAADGRSLVGSAPGDAVGSGGVVNLDNTGVHFVVLSPGWGGGKGAVSWGDGVNGPYLPGPVSAANSFVGATPGDQVGSGGITQLSSGNYVIASPLWNGGGGAVSFASGYAAITGAIGNVDGRSMLGATPADAIGSGGIQTLNNGNFVVLSPNWNNGGTTNAGAVTFGDQNSGFASTGFVSAVNSLVGTHTGDQLGSGGIVNVATSGNGAYLIKSPNYNSGGGAITFARGDTAITGTIGAETGGNSIWGAPGDAIGNGGIQFLDYYYGNYYQYGHFAVLSPNATNPAGGIANAGAVTFGDADTGFTNPGQVSAANSLVGSNAGDNIGSGGIQVLYHPADYSQSNYLILSPNYNSGAGAVTWASGTLAIRGTIGAETHGNSIFGNTVNDSIGSRGITILDNYNFVVQSPLATNPAGNIAQAGAATFGTEAGGFANPGAVSVTNSLMGTSVNDRVGSGIVQSSLSNGLFGIFSPAWNGDAGAITWGNTSTGVTGAVSTSNSLTGNPGDGVGNFSMNYLAGAYYVRHPGWGSNRGAITVIDTAAPTVGVIGSANSLVGASANDNIGSSGVSQSGNLIAVFSPQWNNGAASLAGAVTWGNTALPQFGLTGVVSGANSLIGSTANDQVGSTGALTSISGSLYALRSGTWDNGAAANAGAITWVNTAAPPVGPVSSANSFVGAAAGDALGSATSFYYGSGYVVMRNGGAGNYGAVTWINPGAPVTGVLSAANSLVGANAGDQIGSSGVNFLANGDYYVRSPLFAGSAGAVTIGSQSGGISGVVSAANSLVGQVAGDGIGSTLQTLSGSRLLVNAANADNGGFTNNGRVFIYAGGAGGGAGALGSQLYTDNAGSNVTITPAQITAITATGSNLVLQANSDITLAPGSDIVTTPATGNGGSLTLQAGRSVTLGSSIVSANGNVRIDANDPAANPAQRDPGAASIIMAEGTRIDAGTGRVEMYLHGPTAQGDIAVRSITAGSLVLQNDLGGVQIGARNANTASDLIIAGAADIIASTRISFIGGNGSAHALLSANGQITIDPPQLVMQTGNTPDAYARIVNPNQQFPIRLVVSDCVGCVTVSPYEITGQNLLLTQIFTNGIPINTLLQKVLDEVITRPGDKKNKGDLEVEATDVCN